MWIGIISLFPKMFHAITKYGITSRAVKNGLLNITIWNPRDFSYNRHRKVDDRPYGGGRGMVMMAEPLQAAILAAKTAANDKNTKVIYLSPQGRILDQVNICKLAKCQKLILVCGRYRGIDERLLQIEVDEEWSVGNYVLSGGELPAMTLIDSISRLIPGVINQKNSIIMDSFVNGLLDYPHYTRPAVFRSIKVPSVLLSGHHDQIERWRLKQSLGRTWLKRPEILKSLILTEEQIKLLIEFKNEYS